MASHQVAGLLDLSGRSAIVTGASHGIGAAIARRLAQAGARVLIHYRHQGDEAQQLVRAIQEEGGKAIAVHADLTIHSQVDTMVTQARGELGRIDILVNNAGTYPTCPLADMTLADWKSMFMSNVETSFNCTQAVLPSMQTQGAGCIVNIASIAAMQPAASHAHYTSAKAAIIAFTRACAQEMGPAGIRVNAISPGLIERPGIADAWPEGVARWQDRAPLGRLGTAADIADACLFLVSPAARWISGHNLVVDGGMLAAPLF